LSSALAASRSKSLMHPLGRGIGSAARQAVSARTWDVHPSTCSSGSPRSPRAARATGPMHHRHARQRIFSTLRTGKLVYLLGVSLSTGVRMVAPGVLHSKRMAVRAVAYRSAAGDVRERVRRRMHEVGDVRLITPKRYSPRLPLRRYPSAPFGRKMSGPPVPSGERGGVHPQVRREGCQTTPHPSEDRPCHWLAHAESTRPASTPLEQPRTRHAESGDLSASQRRQDETLVKTHMLGDSVRAARTPF
jgi:hypothetical protein